MERVWALKFSTSSFQNHSVGFVTIWKLFNYFKSWYLYLHNGNNAAYQEVQRKFCVVWSTSSGERPVEWLPRSWDVRSATHLRLINKMNTVPAVMELPVSESKFPSSQNPVLYFAASQVSLELIGSMDMILLTTPLTPMPEKQLFIYIENVTVKQIPQ